MSKAGVLVPAEALQPGDRIVESRTGCIATVRGVFPAAGGVRVVLDEVWCLEFTCEAQQPVWRREA